METHKSFSMVEYVEKQYAGRARDDKYQLLIEVAKQVDSQHRFVDILFEDTRAAMKETLEQTGNQYKRRTLVRTIFAHIEGELSMMRQTVLLWHQLKAITLSDQSLRKLADEIAIFGDDSLMPEKPKRLSLKDNLKFTFEILGSTPGRSHISIDTQSEGWNAFGSAIKIRDNLTHPKAEEHFLMTDSDVEQVMLAWSWFVGVSSQALQVN